MIKAVVFDLDGTLFNRSTSLKEFIYHQYDRWFKNTNIGIREYMRDFIDFDKNGYVSKEEVYKQLVNTHNLDPSLSNGLYEDYLKGFHDHCIPMRGLKELISFLSDSSMMAGLITNGETIFQGRTIDALQIEDLFHCILISEKEGTRKPSEEIFLSCLKRLNVRASEAVYVGDHPENDINAASRVGLQTIWIENDVYGEPERADDKVQSLAEIPNIIHKMNRRMTNEDQ